MTNEERTNEIADLAAKLTELLRGTDTILGYEDMRRAVHIVEIAGLSGQPHVDRTLAAHEAYLNESRTRASEMRGAADRETRRTAAIERIAVALERAADGLAGRSTFGFVPTGGDET